MFYGFEFRIIFLFRNLIKTKRERERERGFDRVLRKFCKMQIFTLQFEHERLKKFDDDQFEIEIEETSNFFVCM